MTVWTVNQQTLLFESLTQGQAEDLENLAYAGQISGNVAFDHSAVVAWFDAAGFNESQRLITYTTAFLPRAALSTSMYFRKALLS